MFTYSKAITATNPPIPDGAYPAQPSEKSRIESWYLDPIVNLRKPEEAMICLALTFLLLDKYFRCIHEMGSTAGYSENCNALRELSEAFPSLNVKDAENVWSDLRNGIMHKGMPNESNLTYLFDPSATKEIQKNSDVVTINPWRLRDWVIRKHRENFKQIWKSDDKNKILGVYSGYSANGN